MTAYQENLIRELRKALPEETTFTGKLYRALMFTENHQNLANYTGVIWCSDYAHFWCNACTFGQLLGIRPNSINKNFTGSGFEIVPTNQIIFPDFLGNKNAWRARRFLRGEFSPEVPPPKTSNWYQEKKRKVIVKSDLIDQHEVTNDKLSSIGLKTEIESFWYENYQKNPPRAIDFAKTVTDMCGSLPIFKYCGIQSIILNEIGQADSILNRHKYVEFCRKYGPPQVAANLLKDITDINGILYYWVQNEPKRVHDWDIYINPWLNTISLHCELTRTISLTSEHKYFTVEPYRGVVIASSLDEMLFVKLNLSRNPLKLKELQVKDNEEKFDPLFTSLDFNFGTNPEFIMNPLNSFLE